MTRIPFHCPHCQVLGETDGKYAGRMVNCPKCQQPFRLEAAGAEPLPVVDTSDSPAFEPVSKLSAWNPIPKLVAWDKKRMARFSAEHQAKKQARIEKQAREIEHAQTVEEDRLARTEVEVLTAIENLLLEQTQKLTGIKKGITGVWWALIWIAMFTMLSCFDSCQRMTGKQEMKVRVVRSLY